MRQLQRAEPRDRGQPAVPKPKPKPEPFDAFFIRERTRAVRLAWLLTRSEAAAEDVAQDAFLAVHRRFEELDSPSAYLSRVVVNRSRRWHARRARDADMATRLAAASGGDGDDAGGPDYLLDVIYPLPFRQRVAIVGRYWAGWSEADIAAALGCRPGTVKSLTSRALTRLRNEIER
jgi:RNA polymerase sigma factor (sigma-70 family)